MWYLALRSRLVGIALVVVAPSLMLGALPVLQFSDLTWGPKTGWEGSTLKGAAVTVWGENFGAERGSNYITVNGSQLAADADYAEWGAAGPARTLQRVTFWLNAYCADGPGNITVTVGGMTSNPLPFTVSAGAIYFISPTGDNTNSGLYSTAQGAGNGPFRDIYKFGFQNNPSGDGQYVVYVRGGTYTTHDPAGDDTAISYRGPSGGPGRQKALVAYPAETPVIDASDMSRGVIWNADYSPYGRNSYLTYSKLTVVNGTEAFYIYGDYNRVIGNRFQKMLEPTWSGVIFVANSEYTSVYGNMFNHNGATIDGSYKHQIYAICTDLAENVSTQYTEIGWNEFADIESGEDNRGGVVFFRKASDAAPDTHARYWYLHDNYFHGGNQNFVEIGDGSVQSDIWIWNNVFVGGPSVNSSISVEWTTANANLFNNTFYLAGSSSVSIIDVVGNAPGSQLASKNNIFYALAGQPFFNVESGSTMSSDHDLFFNAGGGAALPGGYGLAVTNPIAGDPQLVDPVNGDFHLLRISPAIGAGTDSIRDVVKRDYDGYTRPSDGAYAIGAFEYSQRERNAGHRRGGHTVFGDLAGSCSPLSVVPPGPHMGDGLTGARHVIGLGPVHGPGYEPAPGDSDCDFRLDPRLRP